MLTLISGSVATVKRLSETRRVALGHIITPSNRNGMRSIMATCLPWAADNGAFSGFNAERFRWFLSKIANHPRCLFVVCPDMVADARATMTLFEQWAAEVRSTAGQPLAFVLQDGQESLSLPDADAYFIGGTTEFKLSRAALDLAAEGKRRGAWVHMGRVNSRRRLKIAMEMGCDSIDGSSMSKFGDKYIHAFCRWATQLEEQPTLY